MNKPKRKRGQAAIEFLLTYGWVFMIILVLIGALNYFGVLDPSLFISERARIGSGQLRTTDAFKLVNTGENSLLELQIQNDFTERINITSIRIKDHLEETEFSSYNIQNRIIDRTSRADVLFVLDNELTANIINEKKRFDVDIYYKRGTSTVESVIEGELVVTIREEDIPEIGFENKDLLFNLPPEPDGKIINLNINSFNRPFNVYFNLESEEFECDQDYQLHSTHKHLNCENPFLNISDAEENRIRLIFDPNIDEIGTLSINIQENPHYTIIDHQTISISNLE